MIYHFSASSEVAAVINVESLVSTSFCHEVKSFHWPKESKLWHFSFLEIMESGISNFFLCYYHMYI